MNLPIDFRPPQGVKTYNSRSLINWYHEGIFFVYSKAGMTHPLEDAKQQIKFMRGLLGNQKVFVLVDIRKNIPMGMEARNYYGSDEGLYNCTALVFIVNSPLSRVVGNFYMMVVKPKVPFKMFTNIKDAVAWGKKNKLIPTGIVINEQSSETQSPNIE